MDMDHDLLKQILNKAAGRHTKLCPRIVLGVRIGLAGAQAVGLTVPRNDKDMLVFIETDGCFVSGVESATGCSVNHRTMRIVDYGKVAGTFINVNSEQAVRVLPRVGVRQRALEYAPEESRRYFAMLHGYQHMPVDELLMFKEVNLAVPVSTIISRPGLRVQCDYCAEEIINEREIIRGGLTLCRSCAEPGYCQALQADYFISDLVFSQQEPSGVNEIQGTGNRSGGMYGK